MTQTSPVSSLCAVTAGPVVGVQLQPGTLPVSPSRSTQPAANQLKPTETNNSNMVKGAKQEVHASLLLCVLLYSVALDYITHSTTLTL